MVTKQQLDQLRAERQRPQAKLEYNMDGPVHSQVVNSASAERERQLALGERAMRDAQRDMRKELAEARIRGQPSAYFNQSSAPTLKP